MKSIFILLTKSDTWISNVIHWVTGDKYTHISISFHESLQPLYSFSRKYIHIPLPAGLRVEPLHNGFFKKFDYIPCALYELKVSEKVYERAKQEVNWMMRDVDSYRFSVIGLLLCRFNIPLKRPRHYFCSQFVSEILNNSNAVKLPKEPCLMRPSDYTRLSGLKCLFLGEVRALVQNRTFIT